MEHSFFYVKNFGIDQKLVDEQFTLAKNFFELPVSEKEKYEVNYGFVGTLIKFCVVSASNAG